MPIVIGKPAGAAPLRRRRPGAPDRKAAARLLGVGWRLLAAIPLLPCGFIAALASILSILTGLQFPIWIVRHGGIIAMVLALASAVRNPDSRKYAVLCFALGILALLSWSVAGTILRLIHTT